MIATHSLTKSFGDLLAVHDLDLEVPDGAITALLGANGSGKTTTLRSICGLLRPDSGRVEIDGLDPARDPLLARARLGLVPDLTGSYVRLTAREQIDLVASLRGLRGAARREAVSAAITRLELEAIADRRAEGFSAGERMKLSLACALVHGSRGARFGPPNLILDEPTRGLDLLAIRTVRRVLGELRDDGSAVLLASHVLDEVERLADRVVVIARGRIQVAGTPDEVRAAGRSDTLEDAFVALHTTARH
jgi:sodium transport system ATP-binding protein